MTRRLLVLAAALVATTSVHARSLAYEDNKLNFKNCKGEDVTARWRTEGITLSQAGKSPDAPGSAVEFQTWDGACASFGWDGANAQFEVKQGDAASRSNMVHFVAWDGSLWAATRTGAGFYMARIADKGDPDPKRHFKAAADRVTKSNFMQVPAADVLAEELAKSGG